MIESSQVIAEMIAMAKDMQGAMKRDEELRLNPDEIAFTMSWLKRPGTSADGSRDAREAGHRANRKAPRQHHDWLAGAGRVRASMRLMIKGLLRKYKYPGAGVQAGRGAGEGVGSTMGGVANAPKRRRDNIGVAEEQVFRLKRIDIRGTGRTGVFGSALEKLRSSFISELMSSQALIRLLVCLVVVGCCSVPRVDAGATITSLTRLDTDNTPAPETLFTAPTFGGGIYADYTFAYQTWLPYLIGADAVLMVNADSADQDYQLQLTLATPAIVYLMIDDRIADVSAALPWAIAAGFQSTGDKMPVTEFTFAVYSKSVPAGQLTLREQDGQGGNMYTIAAVPVPEPSSGLLVIAAAAMRLGVPLRKRRR